MSKQHPIDVDEEKKEKVGEVLNATSVPLNKEEKIIKATKECSFPTFFPKGKSIKDISKELLSKDLGEISKIKHNEITKEMLDVWMTRDLISEWEYEFLGSVMLESNLTTNQSNIYKKILTKIDRLDEYEKQLQTLRSQFVISKWDKTFLLNTALIPNSDLNAKQMMAKTKLETRMETKWKNLNKKK